MSFTKSSDVRIVGGPVTYYTEATLTNLYVEKIFSANIKTITVTNDSTTDTIQVSWNGATLEGDLKSGESMTFMVSSKQHLYIKGTAGGDKARIFGW